MPDGPLTSRLQNVQVGDELILGRKPAGSLLVDAVDSKENLVLLSTGTGIAPFVPIVQDPWTYERFDRVYLFHTVRHSSELAHKEKLTNLVDFSENFVYICTVTDEPDYDGRKGRFWEHLEAYLPAGLDRDRDSVMVCGSPQLNEHCRSILTETGWVESTPSIMGDFALERAFAD